MTKKTPEVGPMIDEIITRFDKAEVDHMINEIIARLDGVIKLGKALGLETDLLEDGLKLLKLSPRFMDEDCDHSSSTEG